MGPVGRMRWEVLTRDGGCVAPRLDPRAGPCRDRWGYEPKMLHLDELEADYVRLGAKGDRHELPEDHVAVCPGHHRGTGASGGYQWATAHREELRAYLDGLQQRGTNRGKP